MIELQAAREAFDSKKIQEIGWLNRERNVADAVPKHIPFSEMMALLYFDCLNQKLLQWFL